MSFLFGLIGPIIALVGWFAFHSPIAVFIGTAFYIVGIILEWKNLNFGAKKVEISIFVIGCIIGLFIDSAPWYICGLLALQIYGLIVILASLILMFFLSL